MTANAVWRCRSSAAESEAKPVFDTDLHNGPCA